MNTCEDAPCCGCCPKYDVAPCPDCGVVTDGSGCNCDFNDQEPDYDDYDEDEEEDSEVYENEDFGFFGYEGLMED